MNVLTSKSIITKNNRYSDKLIIFYLSGGPIAYTLVY